jgi:membrane protease subunit HflC
MKLKALLAIAGLLVLTLFICAYTVDETEQVVVTRFDKIQRTVTKPGLKFKLPVIEKALVFPNNLQEWDGDPGQIPTRDKDLYMGEHLCPLENRRSGPFP